MLSTRILRTLSVCAVAAFAFVATRASAAPDISTPKKAGVAFAKAVEAGDQEGIKATSTGSDEDYKNVQRWTDAIASRPAVKRGRMVNRVSGDPAKQLHERHDASDFETRTQDKIGEPAKV